MSYTLYYLPNSRGFAEKIRMFLAETGIVRRQKDDKRKEAYSS
jgi:glutathione S-transferase